MEDHFNAQHFIFATLKLSFLPSKRQQELHNNVGSVLLFHWWNKISWGGGRSQLRKKRVIWALSSRVYPIMARQTWWWEVQLAGHTVSSVWEQREKNARAHLSPFDSKTSACGMALPTFKVGLLTSVNPVKTDLRRHAQRLSSYVILDLIKLTGVLPSIDELCTCGKSKMVHFSLYILLQFKSAIWRPGSGGARF